MSEQIQIPELSYFQKRMELLGVTDEINTVHLYQYDADTRENVLQPFRIFREVKQGIDIMVYTIDANPINYAKEGSRWKRNEFCITRLEKPLVTKKGDTIKYLLPKDQPTQPFFPPILLEHFAEKKHIDTLVITEGYFKAFKAAMHGIPCVGLSSITHMKDKNTGNLHDDIKKLVLRCNVQHVIWLMDGDCRNITSKEISDGIDLRKRPQGFFNTCNVFKDLFNEFEHVKRFAAYQLSDELPDKAKGIDDLLCAVPGEEQQYATDLLNVSRKPKFFYREDITFNIARLHRHFLLDNVDQFVIHHGGIRKEIYEKEFQYGGTKYKWNAEKQTCEVVVPGEAKNYFRVGDQYYSYVHIPNKYNEVEVTFHRRMKGTILDDHGKNIIKHIPKYQAFCNVPSHINFQPVINNCFNVYAPFEHEPEDGEFPTIEKFLKHIFGTGTINWKDPKTGERHQIGELDLGLDYMTLLYRNPTQILPILCLVSRDNGTGKSTLAKLLKLMFTQNVAIVGNAELADNFNASWASKLLVICDEAKIDKQVVVEKVKALSTSDKIFMNAKGKDHIEIDFFGKFVFLTNNEDNFIYASEDDVRYWIRKVPRLKMEDLDVNMLQNMQEEIPAFINFLGSRKMATPQRHRAWFDPELIKTDALQKVVAHSMPALEKDLRHKLRTMFMDFGCEVIYMTIDNLREEWFKHKFEGYYFEDVLKNRMKVEPYHTFTYEGKEYESIPKIAQDLHQEALTVEQLAQVQKKFKTKRYSYPRWERVTNAEGKQEMRRVNVAGNGRPYAFYRETFLTPDEIASIDVDAENRMLNEVYDAEEKQTPLPF